LDTFDFTSPQCRSEVDAIKLLATAGFEENAPSVWKALRETARSLRAEGGSVSADELRKRPARTYPELGRLPPLRQDTRNNYSPDPLPETPTFLGCEIDLQALSHDENYLTDEIEDAKRDEAEQLAKQDLLDAWTRLHERDARQPPWDTQLQMYFASAGDEELDIILRNTGAVSAVVDSVSVTLLREYWPIAGEMDSHVSIRIPVDELRVGEEKRVRLPHPLEVLPGRAERLVVDIACSSAVLLRVRIFYNGGYSVAKNSALYDAPENDDLLE
jgi:hypothetical protein